MAQWADHFASLLTTPEGQRAIEQLFSYLLIVAPELTQDELAHRVDAAVPNTENLVVTAGQQLIQQGRKEGLKDGRKDGFRAVVLRQLQLKFGLPSAETLARLNNADEAALGRYCDRILTATSIEEVLRD